MKCCPLDGGGGDRPDYYRAEVRRARKEHRCIECNEPIPAGAQYEHTSMSYDHMPETCRTCLSCVEIRNHFACGRGWIFGDVWPQLRDNFFPTMKAGGPCMEGLSPEAKARLFEKRLAWLEDIAC